MTFSHHDTPFYTVRSSRMMAAALHVHCSSSTVAGGLDWIYCRGYRHKSCPAAAKLKSGEDGTTTFNTLHKKYLGQLDDHVLQQLPGT